MATTKQWIAVESIIARLTNSVRDRLGAASGCCAIDLSALESLEMINQRLREMDVQLHLSEVKGPVMGRLKEQHFLNEMTGTVFLTQFEAAQKIAAKS